MPNVYQYTIDKLGGVVESVIKNKIPMVALFPSTPESKKDNLGNEAFNEDNLVCKATRYIKKKFKNNVGVMCDVALDPYTSHGHDGLLKKNYVENLYAAYKKSFTTIIGYYKKKFRKVKFYELMVSDTFGKHDYRKKIIYTLRMNYFKNKTTPVVSKNLHINLLNVADIISAIEIILKKSVTPKKFLLINSAHTKIFDLVKTFNKKNQKKLKVKWLSNRLIKDKIYPYDKLKGWKPRNSYVRDIINYIKN